MRYQAPSPSSRHAEIMAMDNWRSIPVAKPSYMEVDTPVVQPVGSTSHINVSNASPMTMNTCIPSSFPITAQPSTSLNSFSLMYAPLSPPLPLEDEDTRHSRSIFRTQRGRSVSPHDVYGIGERNYRSSREQRDARDRQIERVERYRRENEEAQEERKKQRARLAAKGLSIDYKITATDKVLNVQPQKRGLFEPNDSNQIEKLQKKVLNSSTWVDPLSTDFKLFEMETGRWPTMAIQTSVMDAASIETPVSMVPAIQTPAVPAPATWVPDVHETRTMASAFQTLVVQTPTNPMAATHATQDSSLNVQVPLGQDTHHHDGPVSMNNNDEDVEMEDVLDECASVLDEIIETDDDFLDEIYDCVPLGDHENLPESTISSSSSWSGEDPDTTLSSLNTSTLHDGSSPAGSYSITEEVLCDAVSPPVPLSNPATPEENSNFSKDGEDAEFLEGLADYLLKDENDFMDSDLNSTFDEITAVEQDVGEMNHDATPDKLIPSERPIDNTGASESTDPTHEASADEENEKTIGIESAQQSLLPEFPRNNSDIAINTLETGHTEATSDLPNEADVAAFERWRDSMTAFTKDELSDEMTSFFQDVCIEIIKEWADKNMLMLAHFVVDWRSDHRKSTFKVEVIEELLHIVTQLDDLLRIFMPEILSQDKKIVDPMVRLIRKDLEVFKNPEFDLGTQTYESLEDSEVVQIKLLHKRLEMAKHANQARKALLKATGLDPSIWHDMHFFANLLEFNAKDPPPWYEVREIVSRIYRTVAFSEYEHDLVTATNNAKMVRADTSRFGYDLHGNVEELEACLLKETHHALERIDREQKMYHEYASDWDLEDDVVFIIRTIDDPSEKVNVCSNLDRGGICPRKDCKFKHPNVSIPSKPARGYTPEPKNLLDILEDEGSGTRKAMWKYLCIGVNKLSGCFNGDSCKHSHVLAGVLCPDEAVGKECPRGYKVCPLIHKSRRACPDFMRHNACSCTDDLRFFHPAGYFDHANSAPASTPSTTFAPVATPMVKIPRALTQRVDSKVQVPKLQLQQRQTPPAQVHAQPASTFESIRQMPQLGAQEAQLRQLRQEPPLEKQQLGPGAGAKRLHGDIAPSNFQAPTEQTAKRQRHAPPVNPPTGPRNPLKKQKHPSEVRNQQQQQQKPQPLVKVPIAQRITREKPQNQDDRVKLQPISMMQRGQAGSEIRRSQTPKAHTQPGEHNIRGAADLPVTIGGRNPRSHSMASKDLLSRQLKSSNSILSGSPIRFEQKRSRNEFETADNGNKPEPDDMIPRGPKRNKGGSRGESSMLSEPKNDGHSRPKKRNSGPNARDRKGQK